MARTWGAPRAAGTAPAWGSGDRPPEPANGFTIEPAPPRHRWDRRRIRRIVAVVVVAALAVFVWLERDTFVELADDVRDTVSGWLGTTPDTERHADDTPTQVQGLVQTAPTTTVAPTTTGDDAFIAWEQANLAELDGRVARAVATADGWSSAFDSGTSLRSMRNETTAVIGDLNALTDLIGTAPDSPARTDALRYLVLTLASFNEILAYLDTGRDDHRIAGLALVEQANADFDRSAERHGGRVWFFQ